MAYRSLGSFEVGNLDGYPSFNGLEYDYEIPDSVVVGSPGGVSSTHHHYTKGLYGEGSSEPDMYAGDGKRYPYAEKGSMYSGGYDSSQLANGFGVPPDTMYTSGMASPLTALNKPPIPSYNTPKSPTREAYISTPNLSPAPPPTPLPSSSSVTIIDISDSEKVEEKKSNLKINPYIIFGILLIAYIAFDYLTDAGRQLADIYLNKGEPMGWKMTLVMGLVATLIFVGIAYFFGLNLVSLETSTM